MIQHIPITDYRATNGKLHQGLHLSYETFGEPLYTAPIVMISHAITGNSNVTGHKGWWQDLIGKGKTIDTDKYTIICFNIPGNGYGQGAMDVFEDHKTFIGRDIACLLYKGLEALKIKKVHALIGSSMGGGIAWELAGIAPKLCKYLIVISTDWKSSDWVKANCLIRDQILANSSDPVHDARLHSMMLYRTPQSLNNRFQESYNHDKGMFNIESWLLHHGNKLKSRFTKEAFRQLNYVSANLDITYGNKTFEQVVGLMDCHIHIISTNSDIFFTADRDYATVERLKAMDFSYTHTIIDSIHGHDAFLIEYKQLNQQLGVWF